MKHKAKAEVPAPTGTSGTYQSGRPECCNSILPRSSEAVETDQTALSSIPETRIPATGGGLR